MCIYYKGRSDLTYNGQEHVIPAGLGGLAKLPNTYVSDQFNNDISKLEQDFLRESVVASFRQIVGPGSRGRMTEKHETKSKVHVIRDQPDESNISLGYIKKGRPKLIPHVKLNTSTGAIIGGFNNEPNFDFRKAIAAFQAQCEEPSKLRIRRFNDNKLPEDVIMFGIQNNIEENFNAFFVKSDTNSFTLGVESIQAIGRSIATNIDGPFITNSLVSSRLTAKWNDQYFRLYGKMAFNILSFIKGEAIIKENCFDNTRSWIANGGENYFATLINEKISGLEPFGLDWPLDAHVFLFLKEKGAVFALCSLYNKSTVKVKLAENAGESHLYDGFICDWMNRREYRLQEYVGICAIKIERGG